MGKNGKKITKIKILREHKIYDKHRIHYQIVLINLLADFIKLNVTINIIMKNMIMQN